MKTCFAFALLAHFGLALSDDDPSHWTEWNHQLELQKGLRLRWDSLDGDWLTMELAVAFSDLAGAQEGLDFLSFWIGPRRGGLHGNDSDRLLLHFTPTDPINNHTYELLHKTANDSTATFRFRRRWSPEGGYAVSEDTSRLHWAFGRVGQEPLGRGSRSVSLRVNREHYVRMPVEEVEGVVKGRGVARVSGAGGELKFWDAKTRNVIKGQTTLYLGGIVQFPAPSPGATSRHITGFRPLLENPARIHHMVVFECEPGPALDKGGPTLDFFSVEAPSIWFSHCGQYAFGWSVGGEGLMLPAGTGLPVQESGLFLLQIHYDNPSEAEFEDTSGFRVYYTESQPGEGQVKDSSFFFIEHRVTMFELIPPGAASFTTTTVCTAECSRALFPPVGVTVTNVQLHAHQLTTAIRLRHFRGGVELSPLAADEAYDPYYQEQRNVNPPRRILPGDEFVVQCEYDSRSRSGPTYGGIESQAEMCVGFLHYYPKVDIQGSCNSQPEYDEFFRVLGVEPPADPILEAAGFPILVGNRSVDFPIPFDVPSMREWTGSTELGKVWEQVNVSTKDGPMTMADYLESYDWKADGGSLEERLYGGKHYAFCPGVLLKKFVVESPAARRSRKYSK